MLWDPAEVLGRSVAVNRSSVPSTGAARFRPDSPAQHQAVCIILVHLTSFSFTCAGFFMSYALLPSSLTLKEKNGMGSRIESKKTVFKQGALITATIPLP